MLIQLRNLIMLLILLVLPTGCVTNIKPSTDTNPSPAEKFSNFNRFDLLPLQAANNEVAGQKAAMAKIQENIKTAWERACNP